MKVWQIAGVLTLGLGSVGALVLARLPAGAQSEPKWMSDYEAARTVSRQTGKPLFVAFR